MATFSDDFSTHATSEVASSAATTGITNWTASFPGSSQDFFTATIVTDAGAIGGKILRLADTGWGAAGTLYPTSIGNVAASTATEALVGWRTLSGITQSDVWNHGAPKMRTNTSNAARHYSNGIKTASGVDTFRLWYVQDANEWTAVGAAYTVSTPYVHGDWWWTRMQVNASGDWLWRSWKDGDTEPTSWQNAAATDTTVTGGYCGVGIHRTAEAGTRLDVQWFSMGTSGDAAPSPPPDGVAMSGSAVTTNAGTSAPGTSVGL